jgi:putative ABC transport system substrate-binding protein
MVPAYGGAVLHAFVSLFVVLTLVATPFASEAQQSSKVYRVGFLHAGPSASPPPNVERIRNGLGALGWKRDVLIIEYRFGEHAQGLAAAAAELVRLDVDVIVAPSTLAGKAAKEATQTIPIVMISGDPVRTGLVTSLARPGANVTGVSSQMAELKAKSLQILLSMAPKASRIGLLMLKDNPASELSWRELEVAAPAVGVKMHRFAVRGLDDIERAFGDMARERLDGLIISGEAAFFSRIRQIVDLAAKGRLPVMYPGRRFVDAGGLVSYSQDNAEVDRLMATYVDRILRGARAADLPIGQAVKLVLVINRKTAKTLGLTIPRSLLLQADQVID